MKKHSIEITQYLSNLFKYESLSSILQSNRNIEYNLVNVNIYEPHFIANFTSQTLACWPGVQIRQSCLNTIPARISFDKDD